MYWTVKIGTSMILWVFATGMILVVKRQFVFFLSQKNPKVKDIYKFATVILFGGGLSIVFAWSAIENLFRVIF